MSNPSHEAMYRRTIESFSRNVRAEQFSEERIPQLTDQLRQELGQCIELLLISPEFYNEMNDVLDRVRAVVPVEA